MFSIFIVLVVFRIRFLQFFNVVLIKDCTVYWSNVCAVRNIHADNILYSAPPDEPVLYIIVQCTVRIENNWSICKILSHVLCMCILKAAFYWSNVCAVRNVYCESKKLGHFFTVSLANVSRFLKLFQCRNQKEMAHNKNEKFPTVA